MYHCCVLHNAYDFKNALLDDHFYQIHKWTHWFNPNPTAVHFQSVHCYYLLMYVKTLHSSTLEMHLCDTAFRLGNLPPKMKYLFSVCWKSSISGTCTIAVSYIMHMTSKMPCWMITFIRSTNGHIDLIQTQLLCISSRCAATIYLCMWRHCTLVHWKCIYVILHLG